MAATLSPLNSTNVRNVPSQSTGPAVRSLGSPDRPVVVLVHGAGGADAEAFAQPLLSTGYKVVLVDRGNERELDAVVSAVESHGTRIAGLVGHSSGAAAVVAWLARTRRDVRCVLIAPPALAIPLDGVRAAALVIDDESGLALARAWPGARFSHDPDLRDDVVARDAADFIARRVVFAPPAAAGAATFGAPAPLY